MLKNKFTPLILVAATLIGCSKKDITSTPEEQKKPAVTSSQAEKHFLKGKDLIIKGSYRNSIFHFDRSIDLLLDSGSDNNQPATLNMLIEQIAEMELGVLKDKSSTSDQTAFLDEVITTPLFVPSQSELLKFRKKLKNRKAYSVPITINPRVLSFVKAFQNIKHKSIQRALDRSAEYIEKYKEIFRKEGMPEDLAYLPLIESGFRSNATSRARAKGQWQFMTGTARLYGLKVDWVVDERRDPYKSAVAAAKYLKYLHKKFGNWYIALAAYNGGPGRLNRAVRRTRTKNFFKIARTRYIRRETRNYVPAFLASLIIVKNPDEYGFKLPEPREGTPVKKVRIPSPVDLKTVSKLTGVSKWELKRLNPELLRDFTPFNRKYYDINVPLETSETFAANLKRLPPSKKYFAGWYRVRRGDNLYSIARKFRTSVRRIKRVNKLRSNLIKPGKRLLIPRGS